MSKTLVITQDPSWAKHWQQHGADVVDHICDTAGYDVVYVDAAMNYEQLPAGFTVVDGLSSTAGAIKAYRAGAAYYMPRDYR